jgi:hypothetical protein
MRLRWSACRGVRRGCYIRPFDVGLGAGPLTVVMLNLFQHNTPTLPVILKQVQDDELGG